MSESMNGAFPIVPYREPRAAIAWLERAFGARATAVHPPEPDSRWYTPRSWSAPGS